MVIEMSWFHDLFINEAKAALNRNNSGSDTGGTNSSDEVVLTDKTTGDKYTILVDKGKLTMKAESEG